MRGGRTWLVALSCDIVMVWSVLSNCSSDGRALWEIRGVWPGSWWWCTCNKQLTVKPIYRIDSLVRSGICAKLTELTKTYVILLVCILLQWKEGHQVQLPVGEVELNINAKDKPLTKVTNKSPRIFIITSNLQRYAQNDNTAQNCDLKCSKNQWKEMCTMNVRRIPDKAVKYSTQRSADLQLSHRNPIPCKAVIITSLIWF